MKRNTPLISIILPVYNTELFIKPCIDSLLIQEFDLFELIIIDDNSNDNTEQIIKSYIINDKRIHYIKNRKNIGNYPSRNKGIEISYGKYIAVMDGDDIALPNRLKLQYEYMEKHSETVALGSNFIFSHNQETTQMPLRHKDIILSLLSGYTLLHPSLLLRKDTVKKLKGYNEQYVYASDYDLTCRLSFSGNIENLSEACMIYRIHPDQITSKKRFLQLEYAENIRKYYQIKFINTYKSKEQESVTEFHVSYPEIGVIIGYYTYTAYTKDKAIEKSADSLLDLFLENIPEGLPVCLNNGLCGIGYGILYLLRNDFINGNENEVLEEIDDIISNNIEKQDQLHTKDILIYKSYRNNGEIVKY